MAIRLSAGSGIERRGGSEISRCNGFGINRDTLARMTAEDEQKEKLQFAAFLLDKRDDAYAAALCLHPTNYGLALRISNYWPVDPVVLAERQRLIQERALVDPTSVTDYLDREARRIIEGELQYSAKDRIAAMELLAKLRGVINADPIDPNKKQLPPQPTYKVVTE